MSSRDVRIVCPRPYSTLLFSHIKVATFWDMTPLYLQRGGSKIIRNHAETFTQTALVNTVALSSAVIFTDYIKFRIC